jgi:hypothetical protein
MPKNESARPRSLSSCEAAAVVKPKARPRALGYQQQNLGGAAEAATSTQKAVALILTRTQDVELETVLSPASQAPLAYIGMVPKARGLALGLTTAAASQLVQLQVDVGE